MRYDTLITGLPVTAEYSDRFINETVIPLLNRWTDMYKETGRRVIVFMAAPPGAGKSTMADLFMRMAEATPGTESFVAIGMDGFHRYQDYLLTHYAERNGEKILMVDIKGAPVTFDLDGLTDRIRRLTEEETVPWPIYDRTTHNPQDGAITVKENIVLIEGNYLLLMEPGWSELGKYADMTMFIKADPEVLRKRLLERKLATCRDKKKAMEFVDFSDMANVRTCLESSSGADVVINMSEDGEYIEYMASCTDSTKKTYVIQHTGELFEQMHPGFWQKEDLDWMTDDMVFSEMLLNLDEAELKHVFGIGNPENGTGAVQFCFYKGDINDIRQAAARVDEKWPEFFNEGDRIYCAIANGIPVSFCILEDMGTYDLGNLKNVHIGGPGCVGTLPEYRRRGIGLELVRRATQILAEEGFDLSYIHYTSVPDWYVKLGYRTVLKWNKYGFI